jgi:hypothetical protein
VGYEKKRKKKSSGALPSMPYDSVKSQQRWEAEDDLRALARAKACREDPERMKRACDLAKEKLDESKAKAEEAAMLIKMGEGKIPEGGM